MRILFASDIHGRWHDFFERVGVISPPPDVVVILGDLETVRFPWERFFVAQDEEELFEGDFSLFYREGRLPYDTYFILGNHEVFYLFSGIERLKGVHPVLLPNLFYMGRYGKGSPFVKGFEVAWLSRIFSPRYYGRPPVRIPVLRRRFRRMNDEWAARHRTRFAPRGARYFVRNDVESLGRLLDASGTPVPLLMHENPLWWIEGHYAPVLRRIVLHEKVSSVICGHQHEPVLGHILTHDREIEVIGVTASDFLVIDLEGEEVSRNLVSVGEGLALNPPGTGWKRPRVMSLEVY